MHDDYNCALISGLHLTRFGFGDVSGGLELPVWVVAFVSSFKKSDVYELNIDLSWGLELPVRVGAFISSFKKSDVYELNSELSRGFELNSELSRGFKLSEVTGCSRRLLLLG